MRNFIIGLYKCIKTILVAAIILVVINSLILYAIGINPFNPNAELHGAKASVKKGSLGSSSELLSKQETMGENNLNNDNNQTSVVQGSEGDLNQNDNNPLNNNPDQNQGQNTDKSENTSKPDNSFNPDNSSTNYFLTQDEVTGLQSISIFDKIKGAQILKDVSKDIISEIISLIQDGVTFDEMKQVNDKLKQVLPEKDLQALMDIINKNKLAMEEKGN